jgi:hypothetical protein
MHRRKALALAGASTFVLGSGLVATAAMAGSFLGFGRTGADGAGSFTATPVVSSSKPRVSVRSRDVYDRYVVDVGAAAQGAASGVPAPAPKPAVLAPLGSVAASLPVAVPHLSRGGAHVVAAPTTVRAVPSQPTPTTNVTSTTRPPGVPDDWPAGKPIPPMPANCKQPQLEDNGVWNCQSDD